MADLIVLIPTRNEEAGIGEVIDRIPHSSIEEKGYGTRIVVVDGHSTDSTCEIARERGAELIQQKTSQGKGLGVREALQIIFRGREPNGDLLIMLDADATYDPEDMPRFIDELQSHDVVWGSRMRGNIEEKAMSRTNRIGNKLLSFAASLLFMKKTTDLCTGYWGFRSKALNELALTAEGFSLEADLFGSVAKSSMKTSEIPIDYAHREGTSTLKWYSDGPRILSMAIKKKFEYTRRPIHDLIYVAAFAILVYSIF
jgi:dolichol-phosphate mannosyltransferase